MNEPHHAVCWLTPDENLNDNRKAVSAPHLRSGLARIDNVFQKTRRLVNSLERPIGTSSTHNKVWHGYAPYNPRMMQKYLTVFRTVHNFVWVGKDDKTPAMRLGFAKEPLEFEDILWPGQWVPRPKAVRRRGKEGDCGLSLRRGTKIEIEAKPACLRQTQGDSVAPRVDRLHMKGDGASFDQARAEPPLLGDIEALQDRWKQPDECV